MRMYSTASVKIEFTTLWINKRCDFMHQVTKFIIVVERVVREVSQKTLIDL